MQVSFRYPEAFRYSQAFHNPPEFGDDLRA